MSCEPKVRNHVVWNCANNGLLTILAQLYLFFTGSNCIRSFCCYFQQYWHENDWVQTHGRWQIYAHASNTNIRAYRRNSSLNVSFPPQNHCCEYSVWPSVFVFLFWDLSDFFTDNIDVFSFHLVAVATRYPFLTLQCEKLWKNLFHMCHSKCYLSSSFGFCLTRYTIRIHFPNWLVGKRFELFCICDFPSAVHSGI